ncbi:MAG: hypothetical protein ACRCZE_00450 [Candidatus Altimarinota bacterium]
MNNSSYSQFKSQFSQEKMQDPAHQQELLGKLKTLSENPNTQQKVADLISALSNSSIVEKLRARWDKLSPTTQWLFFKNPLMNFGINKYANPIRLLIRLDLIKYKGKLSTSDRDGMSKAEKMTARLVVKIGSRFVPELKAVEPYLEPLIQLQEIQDNFINQTRDRIRKNIPIDLEPEPGNDNSYVYPRPSNLQVA